MPELNRGPMLHVGVREQQQKRGSRVRGASMFEVINGKPEEYSSGVDTFRNETDCVTVLFS
jgi:hypothetical protein